LCQKPKLKVGKARPKPANQTDTDFKSRGEFEIFMIGDIVTMGAAIVLNQQLHVDAPSGSHQFLHHVSLLSSRSDGQRRESLAYLTAYAASNGQDGPLPMTIRNLLEKICPLLLDGAAGVRSQLLKLFQALHTDDIGDHVSQILPYVRAGMTHLSRDIRVSAIEFLSFLTQSAGPELVSCPGGWHKTLECFATVLGWRSADASRWSSNKASFGGDVKATARIMQVLAEFLQCGLGQPAPDIRAENLMAVNFPFWHTGQHMIPSKSNAFAYLTLFGPPVDPDNQMLEDRDDRLRVYNDHFRAVIEAGIDAAKKEGGELGRASGLLTKTIERNQGDI